MKGQPEQRIKLGLQGGGSHLPEGAARGEAIKEAAR
jgi:hypothetical protein